MTFTFCFNPDWSVREEFHGIIPGYHCGYNFEVKGRDGRVGFMSCQFETGTPEEVAEDEFQKWFMDNHGFTYTGRVVFQGYFEEHYDFEERDNYYTKVDRPFGDYEPIPVE